MHAHDPFAYDVAVTLFFVFVLAPFAALLLYDLLTTIAHAFRDGFIKGQAKE